MRITERLQELEILLDAFSRRFEEVHRENVQLRARTAELMEELKGLKRENQAKTRQLEDFRRKRSEIVRRIERIRENISVLERPL